MKILLLALLFLFSHSIYANEHRLNFKDLPIPDLIDFFAPILNKSIIYTGSDDRLITFVSPQPVKQNDLLFIFESILNLHNLSLDKSNKNIYKVNSNVQTSFLNSNSLHRGVLFQTPFSLQFHNLVTPLLSETARFSHSNGFVFIFDYLQNIEQVLSIFSTFEFSVLNNKQVKLVKFKNLDLTNESQLVKDFFSLINSTNDSSSTMIKENVIPVINYLTIDSSTMVIYGTGNILLKTSKQLLLLDVPTNLKTNVYVLNHIKPSDITEFLNLKFKPFDDIQKIQVTGQKRELLLFKEYLFELDKPKQTISFNLIISSISSSTADSFNFQLGLSSDNVLSNFGFLKTSTSPFNLFFEYLKSNSDNNILSRPFLNVLDTSTATLTVGKEIPFTTSTVDQTTGQSRDTYERKTIGLNINLTPTITRDGLIKVILKQEFSTVSDYQIDTTNSDLVTDTQTLSTTLTIKPDFIYSFAGLDDSRFSKSKSGFPIFNNIFGSSQNNQSSSKLIIFLQATLLNDINNTHISWQWD